MSTAVLSEFRTMEAAPENRSPLAKALDEVSKQAGGVDAGREAVVTRHRRFALRSRRAVLAALIAAVVAVGGAVWIATPPIVEKTDDAYVGADATTVAPRVKGLVAEVLVRDNQTVHAGTPLVRIDSEEFDARAASAKADLLDAQAGVESARAALASLNAEESLAAASVSAARTTIRASNAEYERAEADHRRYESLLKTGAVAVREVETLRAQAIAAQQDALRSEALLKVSEESQHVTSAKRATLNAALQKAQADTERARAALQLALQDQQHTLIVAPIDGVVGNRQVQQGDYVQPGSRLLTLVPLHDLYVTANFKETQTSRIRPGQHATVRIDALAGRDFDGVVESLAPGSGSEFALLPFEPGTGNFTKIVQRVAVKIRFKVDDEMVAVLRPGLSATAKIDVR